MATTRSDREGEDVGRVLAAGGCGGLLVPGDPVAARGRGEIGPGGVVKRAARMVLGVAAAGDLLGEGRDQARGGAGVGGAALGAEFGQFVVGGVAGAEGDEVGGGDRMHGFLQ